MGWMYAELLLYFGGILLVLYFLGTRNYDYFKSRGVKHIRPSWPFLGNGSSLLFQKEHYVDMLTRLYTKFKDQKYVGLFAGQQPIILLKDVDIMKHVGIKDFDYFHNHHSSVTEEGDFMLANILLLMKDQKWRDMRATLGPAYTSSKMKKIFVYVEEIATDFTKYLVEKAKLNVDKTIEIEAEDCCTRYTNDVIATSAFGLKFNSMADRKNEFYKLGQILTYLSGFRIVKFAIIQLIPSVQKLVNIRIFSPKAVSFFKNIILSTVSARGKSGEIRHDMINIFMETKKRSMNQDENTEKLIDNGFTTEKESTNGKRSINRKWSDDELIAQALVFFIGGFETTSNLIKFFMYEMALNPDIQKRLQNEIDEEIEKLGENISYSDVMNLNYLDMNISETLRLWPPVTVIDRECNKDYILSPADDNSPPYRVESGKSLFIAIYCIQRDPKYFPEPDIFNPERFSKENKSSINPMTYIPFGLGPRICIGSRFALMSAKLIAFHMLAKFDIFVTKNTQIPMKLSFKSLGLLTEKGIHVGLKLRNH